MTPEMMSKIAIWRQKAAEGTLTVEEMQGAIIALRGDRRGAAVASEKSRKAKAPKAEVRADDLLSELEGL
jgi:hypothetical protein